MEKLIFDYSDINENDLYRNCHINKGAKLLSIDKLSSSKEIYLILISNTINKPN